MEKEKDKEIENKEKYETIIPVKKSHNKIQSFNASFQANESNSRIKQNQIGIIPTKGIVYFYSENQIFFMNNSNLHLLLKEIDQLSTESFLSITFEEKINKVFINSNEDQIIVIHYRSNQTLIQLYSLTDIFINLSISKKQSLIINKQCKDIQITSIDSFIILDNDNELTLYSEKGEKVYSYPGKCVLFHYDEKTDITITLNDKLITIYDNEGKSLSSAQLTDYASDIKEYHVLSLYFTHVYIVCYLSKEIENSDDMIIFIQVNDEKKIVDGFIKADFNYIEDKLKQKAAVFYYTINSDPDILFVLNKQAIKLATFFLIEKNIEGADANGEKYTIMNVEPEDDQIITNFPEDDNKMNYFIGMEVIDFKFKGYESVKEIIDSNEYDTPMLALILDTLGRLRVYYLRDSRPGNKLREIHNSELFNKDISKDNKVIADKSKAIVKSSIDLNSKDNLDKGEGINKEKIEAKAYNDKLNALRNNFIRKLQFDLQIKKEIILDQFKLAQLDHEMNTIESKISKTTDYTKFISTLSKESKEYLLKRSDCNRIILQSKEVIDKAKEQIEVFAKKKKEIEHIKSLSGLISKGMQSTSLQSIIISPLFQSFYGKSESIALSRDLSTIEQKCISYSKQMEYNKELVMISQEFNNKISSINKLISTYNKKMLYLNKFADSGNKKEYMEENQNNIFISFIKQFDCYLYELKKVFFNLKQDIEEKNKVNQSIGCFNKNLEQNDKCAIGYKYQFRNNENKIKRPLPLVHDCSENVSRILINTKCNMTYANDDECKSVEELFGLNNNNSAGEQEKKKKIDNAVNDKDILSSIGKLEEDIIRIQNEKQMMNKQNEEEIKKEEDKLRLVKQTEEKYNALNEKILQYEKERETDLLQKKVNKDNKKKEIEQKERQDKLMKEKEERERVEREEKRRIEEKRSKKFDKFDNNKHKDSDKNRSNHSNIFNDATFHQKDNTKNIFVKNEVVNKQEEKKEIETLFKGNSFNSLYLDDAKKKEVKNQEQVPNVVAKSTIIQSNPLQAKADIKDDNQENIAKSTIDKPQNQPNAIPPKIESFNPFSQLSKEKTSDKPNFDINHSANTNANPFSSLNKPKSETFNIQQSSSGLFVSNTTIIPKAQEDKAKPSTSISTIQNSTWNINNNNNANANLTFSTFNVNNNNSIPSTTNIQSPPSFGQTMLLGSSNIINTESSVPFISNAFSQSANPNQQSGFSAISTGNNNFFNANNDKNAKDNTEDFFTN